MCHGRGGRRRHVFHGRACRLHRAGGILHHRVGPTRSLTRLGQVGDLDNLAVGNSHAQRGDRVGTHRRHRQLLDRGRRHNRSLHLDAPLEATNGQRREDEAGGEVDRATERAEHLVALVHERLNAKLGQQERDREQRDAKHRVDDHLVTAAVGVEEHAKARRGRHDVGRGDVGQKQAQGVKAKERARGAKVLLHQGEDGNVLAHDARHAREHRGRYQHEHARVDDDAGDGHDLVVFLAAKLAGNGDVGAREARLEEGVEHHVLEGVARAHAKGLASAHDGLEITGVGADDGDRDD